MGRWTPDLPGFAERLLTLSKPPTGRRAGEAAARRQASTIDLDPQTTEVISDRHTRDSMLEAAGPGGSRAVESPRGESLPIPIGPPVGSFEVADEGHNSGGASTPPRSTPANRQAPAGFAPATSEPALRGEAKPCAEAKTTESCAPFLRNFAYSPRERRRRRRLDRLVPPGSREGYPNEGDHG